MAPKDSFIPNEIKSEGVKLTLILKGLNLTLFLNAL